MLKFISVKKISIICLISLFHTVNSFAIDVEHQNNLDEIKNSQNSVFEKQRKIRFKDILEFTFENNDILNAEREKTKAISTQKFKTIGANALPNIGIELGYGWTDFEERMDVIKFKDDGSTENNKIYLQQPIFKSGRTLTQVKAVNSKIEMQKNKLIQTEQQILFDTIQATLNLIQSKKILDITIQNEESLKSSYEYVVAKRKVGRETLANVSLAKARYSSARTDTIMANTQYLNAKANFSKITKLDPNTIDIDYDKIFNHCFTYDIIFDDVLNSALIKNPQYQIAKSNYNMNKNNLKFAKTSFLPELYLNAQIAKSETTELMDSEDTSIGLSLKIPLFQSGVEYANHKEASYLLNESKFNLNDVKDTLTNQCITTFDEFLSSKSLVMSSKNYRDSAKLTLDNTIAEEKIGRATLIDLLDRRKEYFDTEISYLKYKTNVIKYYYGLRLLMGELRIENLI